MMSISKQFTLKQLWSDFIPAERFEVALNNSPGLIDQAYPLAMLSLMRTASEFERRASTKKLPSDLTVARVEVLLLLFFAGPLSPSEIGRFRMVTRGNMTGLVEGLVADGLVARSAHPEDRRSHRIELTPRGRERVDEYLPQHYEKVTSLMGGLTPDEALELASLLKKLRDGSTAPSS